MKRRPAHRTTRESTPWLTFAIAGGVTLLTRLPLLSSTSYGASTDAWRIVAAGAHFAEHGAFAVSRFPGYPLVELVAAALWGAGLGAPLYFGLATALVSAAGAGALAVLLRAWGVRHAVLGAVAAALLPVVYVNSVSAMDFMWAGSFGVIALLFAQRGGWLWAGVALGLSVGCRPTSVLMAVPVAILILRDRPAGAAVRMLAVGAATALLVWLPVVITFGLDFIRTAPAPIPLIDIARMASIGTWGVLGVIGLGVGLVSIDRERVRVEWAAARALLVGIALFVVLFLVHPHQSGYLIPVVLLSILLLGIALPARRFVLVCLLFAASPFVLDVKGDRTTTVTALGAAEITEGVLVTGAGPVFHFIAFRSFLARLGAELLDAIDDLPENVAIVTGAMQPVITVEALHRRRDPPPGLTYSWPPRTDLMDRTGDTAWLDPPPPDPVAIYCTDPDLVGDGAACIPLPGGP